MEKAIEVKGLTKIFPKDGGFHFLPSAVQKKGIVALSRVNLEIERGKIYGILGPNGAGKTTLIKILTTSVIPTEGSVSIFGLDIVQKEKEVKRFLGLVNSDERSFFWRLTGRQNLHFFACLYRLSKEERNRRIDELLELLDLTDKADVRFYNYSTGMKQKLAIARALISKPRIIFMDEPTRSLDPLGAKTLRIFIKEKLLRTCCSTLILTTHNLDEAEELCDHVAILHKGKVVAEGSVDNLRKMYNKTHVFQFEIENFTDQLLRRLDRIEGVSDLVTLLRTNGTAHLKMALSDAPLLHCVLKEIIDNGGKVSYCTGEEMPLEDIFQSIVSGEQKSLL
jgi:ABC-2 type transport system ATP-binding protein